MGCEKAKRRWMIDFGYAEGSEESAVEFIIIWFLGKSGRLLTVRLFCSSRLSQPQLDRAREGTDPSC